MGRISKVAVFSLILMFASGCSVFSQESPTPTFPPTLTSTAALPTVTEMPPTQELPTITPLPTEVVLPTAIAPMPAVAGVDVLILRSGPGMLFDLITTYKVDTALSVLGKAPGDGWFLVMTPDHRSGWMKADLVTLQGKAEDLPYISPVDVDVLKGHVKTPDGKPASGIGVSLAPANKDLAAGPDSTLSDATGTFYLYIPKDTTGEFILGPNGYNCKGNLIVGKCELPYNMPGAISFSLPADLSITFEFVLVSR
jgi:hypothetical protein